MRTWVAHWSKPDTICRNTMLQLYCSPQFVNATFAGGRNIHRRINAVQLRKLGFHITQPRSIMEVNNKGGDDTTTTINPTITPLQQMIRSSTTGGDGWEKCWEQGLTPWDLKQATPALLHLVRARALPFGRALVPGCGTGYDVVALACPDRHVVGLDISDSAIKRAKEFSTLSQSANHCTFLKEDFFTWQPAELFDLIFDYTFFCAIEPEMRVSWASRMSDLLKPNGELITIMFPIDDDHVGGPPYKVSVTAYEEVLRPMGFQAISIVDNELAVEPRKGKEKVGRWKRTLSKALL